MIFLIIGLVYARESPYTPSEKIPVTPQSAINPDQTVMNINNLTVWVREDGFHDPVVDYSWNGTFPKGTAGMVYSEGMLWGGFVNDGETPQLRAGGSTYKSGNMAGVILIDASGNVTGSEDPDDPLVRAYRVRPDWATADLTDDAANFFLVPIDEVTEDQIEEIRMQYETDWNEWPAGIGAPFQDVDGDGAYDPVVDIPGIPNADQTLWIVYNDLDDEAISALYGSPPIGLEVQETYWAYAHHYSVQNVVFKRVRIIYKGTETTSTDATIDSMYIVQWSDPDLGDHWNDFVGCDTTLDLGYVYNGYKTDLWYKFWGLEPPAGGYAILQGPIQFTDNPSDSAWFDFEKRGGYVNLPMTAATFYGAGSPRSDPRLNDYSGTLQFYNLLRGCEPRPSYPDCDPLLDHLGNPTTFELTGDPVTGMGDLDGHPTLENPMRFPPGDRRLVMATGPFSMTKGDTQEVVIALTGAIGADYLLSVAALKGTVEEVKEVWESGLTAFGLNIKLTEFSVPHNTEDVGPFDLVFLIETDPSWEPEIATSRLHYRVDEHQDSLMLIQEVVNDSVFFAGTVPEFRDVTGTTQLRYYLSVDYEDGSRAYLPYGAPTNYRVMTFGPDTSAPMVSDLKRLPDILYLWDDSATVTVDAEDDRFPISVMLKWQVNSSGAIQESTMDTTTHIPGVVTSLFPFWIGKIHWEDLSVGDTVYYWAGAVDSSMNHNRRISEIRWFLAREYIKIGNWDAYRRSPWQWGEHWSIHTESGRGYIVHLSTSLEAGEGDTLTLLEPFSLAENFPAAFLKFSQQFVIVDPNMAFLELKVDASDWVPLREYSGNQTAYEEEIVSLEPYMGTDSVFIRFRAEGHGSAGSVYWKIDDIFLTIDSVWVTVDGGEFVIPTQFKLHQNYPNPFNPTTTIRFDLPHDTDVELTIYDILGREVETLVSGRMVSGFNKVEWYASNVPSGIYFIRMTIGDPSAVTFSQVRKVMVLK